LDHKINDHTKYHQKVNARQLGGKEKQTGKQLIFIIFFSDHFAHYSMIPTFHVDGIKTVPLKTT